jgi:hypothetical protein
MHARTSESPSKTTALNRRQFVGAAAAGASGLLASGLNAAAAENAPGHATLQAGDLTAVVGDNSAAGEHRAGYNGVWSLRHAVASRSLFVPAVAGLNLEHIVTGEHLDGDHKLFFEPRSAPMSFKQLSASAAELHQPPTPTFHVESWTRFELVAPHYLDMTFRCVAHQPVFPRGYLALFWASYINAPADKSMYFLGGDRQKNLWTQLCTQWHNDQSTVRHRDDTFEMTFPEGSRDTLFKSLSRFRFDEPFFYGNHDELLWLVMFDRTAGIRFTHSPSGGGANPALQTTNPAWDFQFLVPQPEVMKEYGFRVRTVLRPRCSRAELLAEFSKWKGTP